MSGGSLEGRVAIVTGALGLLGRHHCRALAEAGATVVAADLDGSACEAFADELGREVGGERLLGMALDVVDPASARRLGGELVRRFGRIDALVNNAAVQDKFENPNATAELSKFENYPLELFRRMIDVNVTGMFVCCQQIGVAMARAGRGSIVNIASTYGMVAPDQSLYRRPDGTQPFYKSAAYPASKGAVLSFTRFLAAYWGSAGVRVNALSPGGVEAGQEGYFVEAYAKKTPLGRMAQPRDLGGALVFLASDASSYVTGTNLVVDGGFTAW